MEFEDKPSAEFFRNVHTTGASLHRARAVMLVEFYGVGPSRIGWSAALTGISHARLLREVNRNWPAHLHNLEFVVAEDGETGSIVSGGRRVVGSFKISGGRFYGGEPIDGGRFLLV